MPLVKCEPHRGALPLETSPTGFSNVGRRGSVEHQEVACGRRDHESVPR